VAAVAVRTGSTRVKNWLAVLSPEQGSVG